MLAGCWLWLYEVKEGPCILSAAGREGVWRHKGLDLYVHASSCVFCCVNMVEGHDPQSVFR